MLIFAIALGEADVADADCQFLRALAADEYECRGVNSGRSISPLVIVRTPGYFVSTNMNLPKLSSIVWKNSTTAAVIFSRQSTKV